MNTAIEDIFVNPHTCYKFLNKEVTDQILHELYYLIKWGPTSFNSSPIRLKFLKSSESKLKLSKFAIGDNANNILNAPVCAIIGMDIEFWKDLPRNYLREDAKQYFENNENGSEVSAFRNSSIQGGYLIKAANALGLATGPMSGFLNSEVDEEFFKATPIKSNFLCNLGYPDKDGYFERAPRYEFEAIAEII